MGQNTFPTATDSPRSSSYGLSLERGYLQILEKLLLHVTCAQLQSEENKESASIVYSCRPIVQGLEYYQKFEIESQNFGAKKLFAKIGEAHNMHSEFINAKKAWDHGGAGLKSSMLQPTGEWAGWIDDMNQFHEYTQSEKHLDDNGDYFGGIVYDFAHSGFKSQDKEDFLSAFSILAHDEASRMTLLNELMSNLIGVIEAFHFEHRKNVSTNDRTNEKEPSYPFHRFMFPNFKGELVKRDASTGKIGDNSNEETAKAADLTENINFDFLELKGMQITWKWSHDGRVWHFGAENTNKCLKVEFQMPASLNLSLHSGQYIKDDFCLKIRTRRRSMIEKAYGTSMDDFLRDADTENLHLGKNDKDDDKLPNPTAKYEEILWGKDVQIVEKSFIHGDLHLKNILVFEKTRPIILDWQEAEEYGPTAYDYAKAIFSLREQLLPHFNMKKFTKLEDSARKGEPFSELSNFEKQIERAVIKLRQEAGKLNDGLDLEIASFILGLVYLKWYRAVGTNKPEIQLSVLQSAYSLREIISETHKSIF